MFVSSFGGVAFALLFFQESLQLGFHSTPDTNEEVNFNGEFQWFDGDIVLTEEQAQALLVEQSSATLHPPAARHSRESKKWPDGVVPCRISNNLKSKWSPWSPWSQHAPAPYGIQRCTHNCISKRQLEHMYGRAVAIEAESCPIDVSCTESKWSPWSPWTQCSPAPSGIHHRTRNHRDVISKRQLVNMYCHGVAVETESSPMNLSCTESKWSPWSPWSKCNPAPNRTRRRTRNCRDVISKRHLEFSNCSKCDGCTETISLSEGTNMSISVARWQFWIQWRGSLR